MTVTRYDPVELERFCEEIFVSLGVPREDAEVVADSLVRADLEGTYSHGISRLAIYARRIREGRISAQPKIRVNRSGSGRRLALCSNPSTTTER
jgi:LDH2 family malate/lactate/ureidoglycolate dehydrogenase